MVVIAVFPIIQLPAGDLSSLDILLNNVIPKFTLAVDVACMSTNILHVNWKAFNGSATNKNTSKLSNVFGTFKCTVDRCIPYSPVFKPMGLKAGF